MKKNNKVILSNKGKINKVDKCIYMKNIDKSHVIVCLYVEYMLILVNNDHMIKSTKKMLIKRV
jgi:hypothetical protein